MKVRKTLLRWLRAYRRRRHLHKYTYGWVYNQSDGSRRNWARLVRSTGNAEFVLWRPGEQGHKRYYWHLMGAGWQWDFRPYGAKRSN